MYSATKKIYHLDEFTQVINYFGTEWNSVTKSTKFSANEQSTMAVSTSGNFQTEVRREHKQYAGAGWNVSICQLLNPLQSTPVLNERALHVSWTTSLHSTLESYISYLCYTKASRMYTKWTRMRESRASLQEITWRTAGRGEGYYFHAEVLLSRKKGHHSPDGKD